MAFKKGQSGNPSGRPKGSKNKFSIETREWIRKFLIENREQFQYDFMELSPKARAELYASLLPFDAAKQQAISSTINFEELSESQLDEIINRLKDSGKDE